MLRRSLWGIAAAIFVGALPGSICAQSYPLRPIRLVVPFAPSGATDVVSRIVANRLGDALGQQIVVENRAGAEGTIAFDAVARAGADGYTLVAATDAITIVPSIYHKLPIDPQTSFTPIILMATQSHVLAVHASVPAANFKEFVALAKAKPGTLSFASPGTGSSQHLSGALIMKLAGIDLIHVPYKGGGQAIVDLTGGQVPAAVLGSSVVIPQARAGKVRMLAVTSGTRSAALPNIPTLAESGLNGFDVYQWISLLAPAGTPREIITRLNGDATKVLTQPAVRERLEAAGFEAKTGSPKEVEVLIRDGLARWSKLIAELGLKLD
jgi:tripartite-type tricarboxylate transporter receptor subunit TctC